MARLVVELRQLCRHNKDGSYLTQENRKDMLCQMGAQLVAMGYAQMGARDLKGRHVDTLLALWHQQGLSDRTVANRLATLRWWCEKIGRVSVMPKTNAVYALAPRQGAATVSKAWELTDDILAQVSDPCLRLSFELQREFGLRRKECLLLRPWRADQGAGLTLEGSWCKNGRAREVPSDSWPAQRAVLERAKQLVRFKSASMIPRDVRYYYQQRNKYDAQAKKLGLEPLHGLRHAYAMRRYAMLAGWACPLLGGPTREAMTPEQREADRAARQQVSAELGHGRVAVVGLYIGAR